jgi:uncharacterized tellurite resistance protein B-like protein
MRDLKAWIERTLGVGHGGTDAREVASPSLAIAALLVEVLRADFDVSAAERRQVLESIRSLLDLGEEECNRLLEHAERRIDEAHDLYQFTSEINRACAAADKLRLVEELWRVARADATVHKYEEHLIRRVAELLHVPHRDFIGAKLRAGEGEG